MNYINYGKLRRNYQCLWKYLEKQSREQCMQELYELWKIVLWLLTILYDYITVISVNDCKGTEF